LMEAFKHLQDLTTTGVDDTDPINAEIRNTVAAAYEDMNDDFNTPRALSQLFALVPTINSMVDGKLDINKVSTETLELLKSTFAVFINDIFGLKNDLDSGDNHGLVEGLMDLIIDIRQNARANKDWTTSDQIRDKMNELNIALKDGADGTKWSLK